MTATGLIVDAVRNGVRNAIETEDFWGAWARGDDVGADLFTPAGVKVTRSTALKLSAVWASVTLYTDVVSTLPIDSFQKRAGIREPYRPKPRWLDEPNPEQTRVEFFEQVVGSVLLDGTGYVHTPRDSKGEVAEVWCVHPEHVKPFRKDGQVFYRVFDDDSHTVLDRTQMFHIPYFAWPGDLKGVNPIDKAKAMIGLGLASQDHAQRFYGQGMQLAGLIETPDELDETEAKRLKQDLEKNVGGVKKAHLPAVLTAGAKWRQLTITPEQAEFLGSRKFTVNDVARWFRVPPHLIADVEKSTSWGSGIEEQNIAWLTYGIAPKLIRLESAFTKWTLQFPFNRTDAYYRFNVEGLLRAKTADRFLAHARGRQWGWLSADDIREIEDQAPLPDGLGGRYLEPANMRAVNDTADVGGV